MASYLNRKRVKAYLLDEASRTGKSRLTRVSAEALKWLERELVSKMDWLVSVHPHGGPKTIGSPITKTTKTKKERER